MMLPKHIVYVCSTIIFKVTKFGSFCEVSTPKMEASMFLQTDGANLFYYMV